jgi:hypothetical protein
MTIDIKLVQTVAMAIVVYGVINVVYAGMGMTLKPDHVAFNKRISIFVLLASAYVGTGYNNRMTAILFASFYIFKLWNNSLKFLLTSER